jgi:hypothetical protein
MFPCDEVTELCSDLGAQCMCVLEAHDTPHVHECIHGAEWRDPQWTKIKGWWAFDPAPG